jgi:hypothetical protein
MSGSPPSISPCTNSGNPSLPPFCATSAKSKSPTATLIPHWTLQPAAPPRRLDAETPTATAATPATSFDSPTLPTLSPFPPPARSPPKPPRQHSWPSTIPNPSVLAPLPSTSIETANAIRHLPWLKQLDSFSSTKPPLLPPFLLPCPATPVAHFSCHGKANFRSPSRQRSSHGP